MEVLPRGRVILLNGASSSGKTSIGQALLEVLPDPWFLVPVDAIGAMRSTVRSRHLDATETDLLLWRTRLGYHRVVAALASVGNNVVMDYPLSEPWRLDDLLNVLMGYEVTLVEVRCDRDELARREHVRGDRSAGLAHSQRQVYALGEYDIAVDTTNADPAECAQAIMARLPNLVTPKAFERLRARANEADH